ncbi:MAG: sulfotransferase [Pseudomonadota bacterium]
MAEDIDQHKEGLAGAQAKIADGQFGAALAMLSDILRADPMLADALYMKAVCERYLTRWDDAALTLDNLKAAAPEFGRAFQEEGHLYRAMGDEPKALHAYQRACQLNPALEASWRAQGDILQSLGRERDLRNVRVQADQLARQPKEVRAVSNFIYEGKLLKAEKLCRAFLQKNPRHVEAMRLLADLGVRFSVFDDAEFLLESAIEFEPDNIQLRLDYLKVLRKRQKYGAAHELSRALHEKHPSDPMFQSQYAIDCMHTGEFENALALFDKILKQIPDDAATLVSRGHALKTYGRSDDAVQSYKAAYRARGDLGDAYYGLANLKTYRFSDEEISLMREQEADGQLTYASHIQLCFSLGKALEDREEFAAAFGYYERGNDLKRAQCRYDADQMTEELSAQRQACSKELFERLGGKGHPAPDPIFIVGLPRAGSTLLEQILASHSQVDGTFELPNILAMAHRLRRNKGANGSAPYPHALNEMTTEKLSALGRKYIDDTRIHRAGAPFFIDKMPNNFRHIGLIHLTLPNAKIIDARREPMASCFSGFKQLFAEGQEFTYGLEQIGRYYRDYVDLMRHWDDILPGKILRVQHEDVLDDLEAQVRRMLDFCGLPFESACLEFYKTNRSVRTASSEQVRKPINKSGVDQWRSFEPYLEPLKKALGATLTEYRA